MGKALKAKELSRFLRRHAIKLDERHIDFIIRKRRSARLHDLLQEAGCPVDMKLAESLEAIM